MLDLVKKIITFYFENNRKPFLEDLDVWDNNLLMKQWSIFVTLYVNWLVRWSSWNIQKIEDNLVLELIENTIWALNDSRFDKIKETELEKLNIRVDEITNRGKPLSDWGITKIEPSKYGVLVIKTDYEKAAVILPNISWKLLTGSDFAPVLSKKLDDDFEDKNYIVYKIETNFESDL